MNGLVLEIMHSDAVNPPHDFVDYQGDTEAKNIFFENAILV